MPKVTIWVREEDYPIWLAMDKLGEDYRPEWLHERLQESSGIIEQAAAKQETQ